MPIKNSDKTNLIPYQNVRVIVFEKCIISGWALNIISDFLLNRSIN